MEVCLALTLLALISGSIYAVVRGSVEAAASLSENQNRRQEVEGFVDLCRKTFHMLPGQARMESRIREQNGTVFPELIIREAPQLLAWGNVDDLNAVSVLGLIPQTGGRFSLALLRIDPGDDPSADPTAKAQPQDWLPLISDVTKLTWRFYDRRSNNWTEVLTPGQPRPAAVEMTLELADEPSPMRAVFDVIPLAPPLRTNFTERNTQSQNNPPNPVPENRVANP